jgi:hypothetical protein
MARRNPLVCQYIENLSSAALEKYKDIIRDMVGRQHGVYALYKGDKLYYVGLATNLRNRLNHHLKDRHRGLWDRFSVYLTIESGHIKELESLVIRIAQPKGNKQKGGFARSENLLRKMKRQLRQQQKLEWLELIGKEMELIERDDERPGRSAGRRSILAGYVDRAMSLRATYKRKGYRARVRKNGSIRVGKKVFTSPSQAAAEITGQPTNGWWFWKFERAPGQWVRLRELKRR